MRGLGAHPNADLPLLVIEGGGRAQDCAPTLGLVLQLGHHGSCTYPAKSSRSVMVVDVGGVQFVQMRFCKCVGENTVVTPEWTQLLREGWFPATTTRLETAFTFRVLATFHELNLQGKTNLYDFCKTLERLTDNSGTVDVSNIYKPMSHSVRLWRHLTLLKRSGRAHDPLHAEGTKEGQLALACPACPHPGINIPSDWQSAPANVRWLYTLFLMMDANFRARCKDRGFEDVHLTPGWAYYVEESRYQEHLKARSGDRQEENTCSVEHNAILKASIRREGYVASGVGAVLCARHALVRPNGAGDLQLGERQANMDYLAFSTLVGCLLALMISYDIVCQWYRHLWERMSNFPSKMRLDRSKIPEIRFTIPKEHIRVHGPGHSRFSFNFLPRVGRTYGEGIESQWAFMNPLALSTREMSLGARQELMNDHWGSWNWSKIISFGPGLLRPLEEAHAMSLEQGRVFRAYSKTFPPEVVQTWQEMITAWNRDPSKPDPYEEAKSSSSSLARVKHELALEEAAETGQNSVPVHDVSVGVFLQVGLDLEDQQRSLRLRGPNGSSMTALAERQEKRNTLARRIELWRAIQDVHMPMAAALRAGANSNRASSSPNNRARSPHPEDLPLLLPSALPPALLSLDTLASIVSKERRLRLAQLADALDDVRHLRRVLAGAVDHARRNVDGEGQRAVTRFRDVFESFHAKVKRAAERYRAAREAMLVLDPNGSWIRTYQPLLDSDIRGPRRDDDEDAGWSEGRYEVSWIWLAASVSRDDRDFATPASAEEFQASMRVEWARAKARAERWEEEEQLLVEEMRRVIAYCEWKSKWWTTQEDRRSGAVSCEVRRGLRAYAAKQRTVWAGLARASASWWVTYLKTLGPLPSWILPYESYARKVRPRKFKTRPNTASPLGEDSSDDSESEKSSTEDEE